MHGFRTGLVLAGVALAVIVLASPVSYERVDAHDLLGCGSVLDPVPWKPSDSLSAAIMFLRRRRG